MTPGNDSAAEPWPAPAAAGESPSTVDTPTAGEAAFPVAVPVRPWFHGLRPTAGEAVTVTRLAIGLLLAGIPLGVLWWLVAPRRNYEVSADGAFAIVPESEAAVGSDGWFMLLTAVVALAAAALAWRREAHRGPLMAAGLAVGVLLCGLVTWQVGTLLGPGPSSAALQDIGAVVLGPLGLRAYGVLVVGPFLAVAGYLLAVCFAPRDDLRANNRPHREGDPPTSVG